ncbi:MAG: hypothetical protein KJ069_21125 [Anaerolineae bacterium]|nr:hypothetical protein [Anaerolineae bacterium]
MKRRFLASKNLWIMLVLLLANGFAWLLVAGRVDWAKAAPILHPEIAEVRAHWRARDAIGEPFQLVITDQIAAETIAWFIEPRPNLPFSHPQVEIHPDGVVGRGLLHVGGLRTPVYGRATVTLIDGKPVGQIQELGMGGATAPDFLVEMVARAQSAYDSLQLPIELTRLELREGEVIVEGVYR